VVTIAWEESVRIVHSRYPFTGIFDSIADPADIERVFELEQRTNDRFRDETGDIALVRAADRISGPGSTPIMASFTHSRASRFCDSVYGVYYAARVLDTAVAETVFHVEALYRSTAEESADVDMRVYLARIAGSFDDLLSAPASDPRLDPHSYAASQAYARALHDKNVADGILYPSVRDPERRACVACFRPRNISSCRSDRYLTYRWDGTQQRITATFHRESLTGT
jgi:hypothetical protein